MLPIRRDALLDFAQSTYDAAAECGHWDRTALDRAPGELDKLKLAAIQNRNVFEALLDELGDLLVHQLARDREVALGRQPAEADRRAPLGRHGVNMTSLQSRPIAGRPWNYQFYADLEGHPLDASVSAALRELAPQAGSYVVRTAQAYRPHVLDMFEPQDHPNDFAFPGAPPTPPYDNAGWTLAYQMGVKFDRILEGFTGPFEKVTDWFAAYPDVIAKHTKDAGAK